MSKRVLMVGLRTDVVDFEKWPQLTPEKLEAAFRDVKADMEQKGYDAQWCLVDRGETAVDVFSAALVEEAYDVILIGAGVRRDPDHLLLLERLINAALVLAPTSRVAFNTSPFDTTQAVERWL